MIDFNSIIHVTFKEMGEGCLVKAGKYENINGKLLVKESPVYENRIRGISLPESFTKNVLTRPIPPKNKGAFNRFIRTYEGMLWKNWNKISNGTKVDVHVKALASSIGCTLVSYDII